MYATSGLELLNILRQWYTKECKNMQYAYSYAVYMMQCQGAWRHGGAYIHTPYTALIWQTSNDKEKQTLSFLSLII